MKPTVVILLACLFPCMTGALSGGNLSVEARLKQFPTQELPIEGRVEILWDSHQIPYIVAENDEDLAFALGMVHAHLRLGQITVLSRLSQARISEMFGPSTFKIDASLRILNLGYASQEIYSTMDPVARRWLDRFVEGLNHYQFHTPLNPPEFAWLGLKKEVFTPTDIITLGRLAGTDVNWIRFLQFIDNHANDPENWESRWNKVRENNKKASPSLHMSQDNQALGEFARLLNSVSRSGSNALVIGPEKSRSGNAILVNDPHLGIYTPNFFLLAGVQTPDTHCVGMMIPGIPFFAIGRNPQLAWGGTNMHAASSDIFDARGVKLGLLREKSELIRIRFWRNRTIRTRWTPFGPILSDMPFLNKKVDIPITLKWMGHHPSDEIGAFLKANKAVSAEEFSIAFQDYGVSGQNMLFATMDGDIGIVPAVKLPKRTHAFPQSLIQDPSSSDNAWDSILSSQDIGTVINPSEGFIASANNPPIDGPVTFGYFYGRNDRFDRMKKLLSDTRQWTLQEIMDLQRDTFSQTSLDAAKAICSIMENTLLQHRFAPLYWELKAWDGRYEAESRGPAAFQTIAFHLFKTFPRGDLPTDGFHPETIPAIIAELDLSNPKTSKDLDDAFMAAFESFRSAPKWGDLHRVRLSHFLGRIPIIGRAFNYGSFPVGGSNDTLFKTSHNNTLEPHHTSYGSQSRFIADMGDIDSNFFILFGGQDGWIGSATMKDQFGMWDRGDYIRIPLREASVRASFQYQTVLSAGLSSSL